MRKNIYPPYVSYSVIRDEKYIITWVTAFTLNENILQVCIKALTRTKRTTILKVTAYYRSIRIRIMTVKAFKTV